MEERLESMTRDLVAAKQEHDAAQRAEKRAKKRLDDIQIQVWEYLEEHKQKTTTVELESGDVQLQRRATTTGRILDYDTAAAALKEAGLDYVLGDPEVRKKVLNELVRQRQKSGEPLPEGIDFNTKRYITVTHKKG